AVAILVACGSIRVPGKRGLARTDPVPTPATAHRPANSSQMSAAVSTPFLPAALESHCAHLPAWHDRRETNSSSCIAPGLDRIPLGSFATLLQDRAQYTTMSLFPDDH